MSQTWEPAEGESITQGINDGLDDISEADVVIYEDDLDDDLVDEASEAALERAMRAARAEFGDFDGDLADLVTAHNQAGLPVLAVVGRPNVGKSTLVNRIIGRREAVVEDIPGVTRDRVTYQAEWNGKTFLLIDTGGWDRKTRGLAAQIAAQAERAIAEADAVMFVVDAMVGATATDEAVVEVLRRSGKPVLLVANKADDHNAELEATSLWSLGLGEPHPVSALHGRGPWADLGKRARSIGVEADHDKTHLPQGRRLSTKVVDNSVDARSRRWLSYVCYCAILALVKI